MDPILHAGVEHPSLFWVVVPSLLSFVAGIGVGSYLGRSEPSVETNSVPTNE